MDFSVCKCMILAYRHVSILAKLISILHFCSKNLWFLHKPMWCSTHLRIIYLALVTEYLYINRHNEDVEIKLCNMQDMWCDLGKPTTWWKLNILDFSTISKILFPVSETSYILPPWYIHLKLISKLIWENKNITILRLFC